MHMLCNSVPYISITRLSNRNVFVFSQMTKILCLSWTTKLTRVSSRESFWSSSCVGYWQLGFILIQFRKAAWIWLLESSDQTVKTMLGAHARLILNITIVLCTLTLIFTRGLIHYKIWNNFITAIFFAFLWCAGCYCTSNTSRRADITFGRVNWQQNKAQRFKNNYFAIFLN